MRRVIIAIVLSWACVSGGNANYLQEESTQLICRDDRGTNRCSDAEQERMRALYGVRSIEAHRDAGDQLRRVFYVDGYGRDLIMIAFLRSPGSDPTAWVHYPRREGQPWPEPMKAAVPQAIWDRVIRRSEDFHRTYALLSGEDPESRSICLHGWVYAIEALDRPRGRLPAELRRKTESACENGPGSEFAEELAALALALFPHCAAIDLEKQRNEATVLDLCRVLSGDRLAAAEVLNLANGFLQLQDSDDAYRIRGAFADQTAIEWAGERYTGPGYRAAEFWLSQLQRRTTNLYIAGIEGRSADQVLLTGTLARSADTPRGRNTGYEQARVEQSWRRDNNGEMRLERAVVSAWQPSSP